MKYSVYFTYKDITGVTRRYSKSGFSTKKEAREHEAVIRVEYAKNKDIVRNSSVTFNEVFYEYMKLEGATKYAPSTSRYYWFTFHNYIENGIGKREIFQLRYKELQKYFNDISTIGYSTVKNIKKIFNVTYKFALKLSYIPSNPMVMVTLNRETEQDEKIKEIDENQFRELCKHTLELNKMVPDKELQEWNNFTYFIALQIGWYMGLRISETLALTKSDFDFENNRVYINKRLEYHGKKKDEIYLTHRMKTAGSKKYLPLALPLKE